MKLRLMLFTINIALSVCLLTNSALAKVKQNSNGTATTQRFSVHVVATDAPFLLSVNEAKKIKRALS